MRPSYEEFWADWTTSGPTDWRSPHHGHPPADVVDLFDVADERGLTIELHLADEMPLGIRERQYRRLGHLKAVTVGGRTVEQADAGKLTLIDAADELRRRLQSV